MHGIGRHDRYRLDTVGAPGFDPGHLRKVAVDTFWVHAVGLRGSQVALRVAGKHPGDQLEVPVKVSGVAVGGADRRLQAATNETQAQPLAGVGECFHASPPCCARSSRAKWSMANT
ncbi:hypothetical protein D3C80_1770880 [compost metagenome]